MFSRKSIMGISTPTFLLDLEKVGVVVSVIDFLENICVSSNGTQKLQN